MVSKMSDSRIGGAHGSGSVKEVFLPLPTDDQGLSGMIDEAVTGEKPEPEYLAE